MFKIFLTTILFVLIFFDDLSANCLMVKDLTNKKILIQNGDDCNTRYSPASSFKIAIALMSFNERLLIDENNPKIRYEKKYRKELGFEPLENWLGDQTPRTWMENSTVWYSQITLQKLGMDKFRTYIKKFKYGNQDLSGDFEKNNGLNHAWLSSSLTISPSEQIEFLQNFLLNKNTIISDESRLRTKNIMRRKNLDFNDWKIYGKTGSGFTLNEVHKKGIHKPFGWFVGFMEKDNKKIAFANYVSKENKSDEEVYLGQYAVETAMSEMLNVNKSGKF